MTEYYKTPVNITKKQQRSIATAVSNGKGVRIKFSYEQLMSEPNAEMLLTKTQLNQLMKAGELRKGIVITLSKKQLNAMKRGGILPVLLGALVSSLAPVVFNRLFPGKKEQDGDGIFVPGGRGGAILPDNGGNTQYHLTGDGTSYLPSDSKTWGGGIVLPGVNARASGSKRQKALGSVKKKTIMLESPYARGAGSTMPTRCRLPKGEGLNPNTIYRQPNSEIFQYLE